MKVAIMQPYFLPYMGYISLIKQSDLFILLDTVQWIRHGWIERNRIVKPSEGWLYVKVPLIKTSSTALIKDVFIDNSLPWKRKILAQVEPYKKVAPHYYKVHDLLQSVFLEEYTSIVHLNKRILEAICSYLGFRREVLVFSEMNQEIELPKASDEWALNICNALKKDRNKIHYINPIGGMEFFDPSKFTAQTIDISFQKMHLKSYDQRRSVFEPAMSILDVLMFNTVEQIHVLLDQFEWITYHSNNEAHKISFG